MWMATQDLPRTAGHPFYARLNQILDEYDFDEYVEELCQRPSRIGPVPRHDLAAVPGQERIGARLLPPEKPLFYPDRINAPHR
jgi:hypothetical protein